MACAYEPTARTPHTYPFNEKTPVARSEVYNRLDLFELIEFRVYTSVAYLILGTLWYLRTLLSAVNVDTSYYMAVLLSRYTHVEDLTVHIK